MAQRESMHLPGFLTTTPVGIFCSDHLLPLCFCPLPKMLEVEQSISVIGKLKPVAGCTLTSTFTVLWKSRGREKKCFWTHRVHCHVLHDESTLKSSCTISFSSVSSVSHIGRSNWIFHQGNAPCHKSTASTII